MTASHTVLPDTSTAFSSVGKLIVYAVVGLTIKNLEQ